MINMGTKKQNEAQQTNETPQHKELKVYGLKRELVHNTPDLRVDWADLRVDWARVGDDGDPLAMLAELRATQTAADEAHGRAERFEREIAAARTALASAEASFAGTESPDDWAAVTKSKAEVDRLTFLSAKSNEKREETAELAKQAREALDRVLDTRLLDAACAGVDTAGRLAEEQRLAAGIIKAHAELAAKLDAMLVDCKQFGDRAAIARHLAQSIDPERDVSGETPRARVETLVRLVARRGEFDVVADTFGDDQEAMKLQHDGRFVPNAKSRTLDRWLSGTNFRITDEPSDFTFDVGGGSKVFVKDRAEEIQELARAHEEQAKHEAELKRKREAFENDRLKRGNDAHKKAYRQAYEEIFNSRKYQDETDLQRRAMAIADEARKEAMRETMQS